ncbi:MAG: hypothetical protein F4029_12080 [Gammaproteobacteria bacterium]|nr:hypothetical protein [Gammaproteobacteria bacterium]MYF29513.1 hypothetical protein [Gammaproteobacteria bacterium]MYK46952.1 hypothetical protein [Gammaproteobacteria bacterium]
MSNPLWLAAFTIVCAVSGGGLTHALGAPLWLGIVAGAALVIPAWAAWLTAPDSSVFKGFDGRRWAEFTALALLVMMAATMAFTGLFPVLRLVDVPLKIESNLSMLLMAPVLYGTYIVLNGRSSTARAVTISDQLGRALSGPPLVLSLVMALALGTGAVLAIHYVGLTVPSWEFLAVKFTQRGIIPPLTLVLFFWGLLLLGNKAWSVNRERRLLAGVHGDSMLVRAHSDAVARTLEIDGFVEMMWRKSADFYVVPRYLNWAIPILGFIGTVLGISLAADGIQNIIGSGRGLSDLSGDLGEAIAPLGIAFDTTLIALSLSVVLTFLQIGLQRREDNILGDFENWVRNGAGAGRKPSRGDPPGPPGP